jgi:putative hydrolases of HD superfamily
MMRGDELLNFWSLAIRLKKLRRQGWIDRGVNDPESTADHSWAVALLAWLLVHDRPELDRDRVLLLGLVHDLPEAVAGDATPFDADRDEYGAIPAERFHALPSYSDDAFPTCCMDCPAI